MPLGLESTTPTCRLPARPFRGFAPGLSLGLAAACCAAACYIDPPSPPPTLRYGLSEETQATDPQTHEPFLSPKVQDHIRGSLEMLFGTPSNPQYMLLAQWAEDSYDPNYPQYGKGDNGSGELTEQELAEVKADNQRRFQETLGLIEAGRWSEVLPPPMAPDLRESWKALREELQAGRLKEEEFKTEAKALFTDWYPTLRDSSEFYRQQCLHCHGVDGSGNGPTARFLDPLPRDYRRGIFKFTAVKDKAMPRRADLMRVLENGATGTAMPSFRRFSAAELNGAVDYVRLLSMRGMVERDLANTAKNDEPITPEAVAEAYQTVHDKWGKAPEKFFAYDGEVPPATPESIAHGKELFLDATKGNCFSCHGTGGRADGPSLKKNAAGLLIVENPDDWGREIRPRNLTQGWFRGGKRPIDIYRRIYAGINGTPMPALGESKDANGNPLLSQQDLWDIVHYVRSLTETPREHSPSSTHE
jgi:mono/diheme cytochrome c family protein